MGAGQPPSLAELRLLRYFAAVADELHFGRAAHRLAVSQPSLSRQIRQLEDAVGVALFDRSRRSVSLTDAGHRLLPAAREALAAAARFDAEARRVAAGRRHLLRLAFKAQAANEMTPVILREYERRHPDVEVELRQGDMRDVSAGLRNGDVDLAIVRLPIDTTGLAVLVLFREPRVAVLPADHPLAREPEISLSALFGNPWVQPADEDETYRRFALALAQRREPAVLGPVVRSIDEYLETVVAGRGVGLAPDSARRYYRRPGVVYVPVRDAEPSVVALARVDGRPAPRPVQDFLAVAAGVVAASTARGSRPSAG